MNIQEAQTAIAVLKTEIERYERLKRTEEAWAQTYCALQEALDARNYLYIAFSRMKEMSNGQVYNLIREVLDELHEPGGTRFKSVWFSGNLPEEGVSEKASRYRSDRIREMFERRVVE